MPIRSEGEAGKGARRPKGAWAAGVLGALLLALLIVPWFKPNPHVGSLEAWIEAGYHSEAPAIPAWEWVNEGDTGGGHALIPTPFGTVGYAFYWLRHPTRL